MPSRRAVLATCGALSLAGCGRVLGDDVPVVDDATDGPPSVDGTWRQPRRDARNTAREPDASGLEEPPSRYWELSPELADRDFYATPAVDGDEAFLTDADHLLRVDLADGSLTPLAETPYLARVAPTVTDDAVYLPGGNELLEFEREDWTSRDRTGPMGIGSPSVDGGQFYAGIESGDPQVFGIDLSADEYLFRVDAHLHGSAPCVLDDAVVFGDRTPQVFATTRDGDRRWTRRPPGDYVAGSVAGDGDAVYVPIGTRRHEEGYVVAYDHAGEELWRTSFDRSVYGHPAVGDGVVYVADYDARLHALDAGTGERRWARPDGLLSSPSRQGPVSEHDHSPIVAGDVVVFPNHDGDLVGFDVDGELLWRTDDGATTRAVCAGDGVLYGGFRSLGFLAP